MTATVHVEGISSKTSQDEIRSFFSFCGKIQSLSVTPTNNDLQSATVTFEKETAARTALLLDNTQLGPNSVQVTAAKSLDELAAEKRSSAEESAKDHHDHVEQEDKPRGRIVAEYLAHGYLISDKAIEKALELDKQHGVSNRFTTALKSFDDKFKAVEKAQAVDNKLGVTDKVNWGWRSLASYYDKAAGSPTGQKLRQFYETGNKTVMDVHNEARHLADLKASKQQAGHAEGEKPSVEEAGVEQIPGSEKTRCNCGSSAEKCPCPPGKCACNNCAKAEGSAPSYAEAASI